MTPVDPIDRGVQGNVQSGGSVRRYYLTAQELDAGVALQLQQRAEQGFGEVAPIVLSRIAQIVSMVGSEMATTVPTSATDDYVGGTRAA